VTFSICIDVAPLGNDFDEEKTIEIVRRLLKVGLENFGLGGKKRKGYGWFEVSEKHKCQICFFGSVFI